MQAAGDGVFELNVECWQIGAQASFTATKVSMASKIAKLNTKYIDKISKAFWLIIRTEFQRGGRVKNI